MSTSDCGCNLPTADETERIIATIRTVTDDTPIAIIADIAKSTVRKVMDVSEHLRKHVNRAAPTPSSGSFNIEP